MKQVTENFSNYLRSRFNESERPRATFEVYSENTTGLIAELYDKLNSTELKRWKDEYAKVNCYLVRWDFKPGS